MKTTLKLLFVFGILLISFYSSGQITYDYYKNPEKIGSSNPDATASFIKAFEFIMQWGKEDADSAILYLNKAIDEDSLYAIAYATLGHMMMYKGYNGTQRDYDSIRTLGFKAIEINPECGDALTLLARITDGEEGLNYARKATMAEPDHRETWLWLGMMYFWDKPDSAIYAFNKATEVDTAFGQGHQKLGYLYLYSDRKDCNQAAYHFRKMIDLFENFTPRDNRMILGYEGLAEALICNKQWDSAIDTLIILKEKCKDNPLLWSDKLMAKANVDFVAAYMGKSYSEFEKFAEWGEHRQKENPDDNTLTLDIIYDYYDLSNLLEDVIFIDSLIKNEKVLVQKIIDNNGSDEDLVSALFIEIFIYSKFKKYQEAKEELDKMALKFQGKKEIITNIHYLMALSYYWMKDEKKAIKYLKTALKEGFDDIDRIDMDFSDLKDKKAFQKIKKKS